MDKGAHFRKCDFQVHSPRDINWHGLRPVSDEERMEYAFDFVRACREKGVGAVAITDHHDMEFVPYIKRAAEDERDETGEEIPAEERLVVFPGMELTLQQPCQALLIFDEAFTEDLYVIAYSCLGIVPSARHAPTTEQTLQLPYDIHHLHEKLDAHPSLSGKYIVFPNVTEGGHQTLMRTGFHGHYVKMPCVGGYTDGAFSGSAGYRSKLEGKVSQWGNKAIGVFQTSDCRRRDFAGLGEPSTWVKWSEPTAEALRQACLARESRVSLSPPQLPPSGITSVSVSSARFLGNLVLEFNPQYTAVIGGRGTGKSTILEYVRWALCDEPSQAADDEPADFQGRRSKLVERTLAENGGSVEVRFIKNGVPHAVRRTAAERRLLLKIDDGEFETVPEEQVRSILPIQAYSQKQLSSVGIRIEQLRRFVEAPILAGLEEIDRRMDALTGELREQFARFVRKKQLAADYGNALKESRSKEAQVRAYRKNLVGIPPAVRASIALKPASDEEDRYAASLERDVQSARSAFATALKAIEGLPAPLPTDINAFPNADLLLSVKDATSGLLYALRQSIGEAIRAVDISCAEGSVLPKLRAELAERRSSYLQEYEDSKSRSSAHESVLKQLAGLEAELAARRTEVDDLSETLRGLEDADAAFPDLLAQWRGLGSSKGALMEGQCAALTSLSERRIRATLVKSADFSKPSEYFSNVVRGTGIRSQKIDATFEKAASSMSPMDRWIGVLDELLSLALLDKNVDSSAPLPTCSLLSETFARADIEKIATKLGPDEWLALALSAVEHRPKFEYMAQAEEYIAFEDASAGQQATALLWALLNQDGPPLIIDQPEDDLDSQIIVEIVGQVWKAKSRRQLIFSSHNANLVVNGDAELVACCDYLAAGVQSKGHVKLEGAIDMKSIREEITKVMEGGHLAFKLRKSKYGF